ncbi:flagellar basal body P-ring formation protein FlgA [Syntrophotalea carbinolica DSM 2380]|uniref:Flagella basal body P-ring formation protein FlgA n=1 Tax=Syntrophotalea carbinolica (strain DSM 2380 / NBRC 103641 / GraBd1) TaxID=338963 RepID=Q3A5F3_SYNC1|nr:flagellar basal body P-ring formation chaperone FlgA [Syntrophotalea carbinolica]ABA88404.1 flagellar basal body P-ring formation protein FlgA [Syntrophotalea carbinolica DSM 2380]
MAFAQRTGLLTVFLLLVTAVPSVFAASQTVKIEQENIRKVLTSYLQTQQKRYPQAQIRLREIQRITPFAIPAGRLRWEVTPSSRRLFDSRRFNLILRSNGTVVKNMTLFADLEALAPVAVAAADLPRGTILQAEDLSMVTMDLAGLRAPCLDAQQMVGKKLRRPVRMGAPFTQTGLETPPLIKRGDMVTITASVGALTVTTRGLAQESGIADETIRVKNIRSKKEIFCRVTAPSAVEVEL